MEQPADAINIADNLSKWARAQPRVPAILDRGRVLDFAQLDRATWRAAAWFRARGVGPGTVVATRLGDHSRHLISAFALARIGAVRLLLPRRETPAYFARTAKAFGATFVLAGPSAPGIDGLRLLHPDPQWMDNGGTGIDEAVRVPGGDRVWAIILTSGTTDAPKAVRQSHADYLARRALNQGPHFVQSGDRYLAAISLGTQLGLRMCLDALWFGGSVVVGVRFEEPGVLLRELRDSSATFVYLTPQFLHRVLAEVTTDGVSLPGLRVLRTGGMVVTPALGELVRRRLSPNFVNGYGLNDLDCAIAAADGPMQARFPGTVGRPLPGVELETIDAAGARLPAGEAGEIRVRVPRMPAGYIDHPEATRRAFRDGWFHTGDIGMIDRDGMLYLKGRADDMMNLDGIKLFPSDIEAALLEHPAVAEAAAFAVDSERHQHIPSAAVVLRAPAEVAALKAWCIGRLGRRAPQWIVVVAALPRNAMGKVARRELVARVMPMYPGERR